MYLVVHKQQQFYQKEVIAILQVCPINLSLLRFRQKDRNPFFHLLPLMKELVPYQISPIQDCVLRCKWQGQSNFVMALQLQFSFVLQRVVIALSSTQVDVHPLLDQNLDELFLASPVFQVGLCLIFCQILNLNILTVLNSKFDSNLLFRYHLALILSGQPVFQRTKSN
ncbi:Hypothetical_protein [Hexamita inflata]|uniref:Hypothetical_protein n=1 Tax=Hexamita inflata TaxID=28002 RepID=A0ABP1GDK9_9EUKA